MCLYSHRLVLDILGVNIDAVVHPLQRDGAASHDDCTTREKTNPASRAQDIEDWVGIESIVTITFLNPEPVGDSNATADAQSR